MIAFALFGVIVSWMTHATYSYEDCKGLDFKPKACVTSEAFKEE